MNRLIKILIFVSFSINGYCQSAIINFIHINKLENIDTFSFSIVSLPYSLIENDNIEGELISTKKNGDTSITSLKYKINATTCALIGDGFGHEIIISPNDTINIFCEPFVNGNHYLKDGSPSTWNFKMFYTGKSAANFAFFDSLTYFDGGLNGNNLNFHPFQDSLNYFFKKVNAQYNKRLLFLNKYTA